MNVTLVMFRADGRRRDFPLRKPVTILGRKETCDLRLPLPSVSRQHCQVEMRNGSLLVRDLKSSNGTFVNKKKVPKAALNAGDVVTVGPIHFIVLLDGQPDPVEPVLSYLPGEKAPQAQAAVAPAIDEEELLMPAQEEAQAVAAQADSEEITASESQTDQESDLPVLELEDEEEAGALQEPVALAEAESAADTDEPLEIAEIAEAQVQDEEAEPVALVEEEELTEAIELTEEEAPDEILAQEPVELEESVPPTAAQEAEEAPIELTQAVEEAEESPVELAQAVQAPALETEELAEQQVGPLTNSDSVEDAPIELIQAIEEAEEAPMELAEEAPPAQPSQSLEELEVELEPTEEAAVDLGQMTLEETDKPASGDLENLLGDSRTDEQAEPGVSLREESETTPAPELEEVQLEEVDQPIEPLPVALEAEDQEVELEAPTAEQAEESNPFAALESMSEGEPEDLTDDFLKELSNALEEDTEEKA